VPKDLPKDVHSVLVVDDEEIIRDVMRDILTDSGYLVDIAEDGKIALEKLKEKPYDLVFADIRMPVMDGLELLKRVKVSTPTLDIIMMTGFASVDIAVEAMRLGAFDFITKPCNADHIRIVARRVIDGKKLQKQAEEREYYRQLSLTDGLTELYNHRYFYDLLDIEVSRSNRKDRKFCLHMIDVDDFKIYNDTLGHKQGDHALRFLAWLLKHHARMSDMVCRYGGEEFAIIAPETDTDEARIAAERFRHIVEETEFEHQDVMPTKNITISLGIACFPDDSQDPNDLVRKADEALYQAKREGKNKVIAWSEMSKNSTKNT
jgi:diguanylate cyclase (GGDEF)-like protein